VNNNEIANKLYAIHGGDKTAFEELYKDLRIPVFTIIYRVTWDKAISEDLLQEVFIKLFLKPLEPEIKNPRAYIFQIARNLAIDSIRKESRHIPLDEISDVVHLPLDDFSLKMEIDDALKSLPASECEIVTLRIIGGLSAFRQSEIFTQRTDSGQQ